MTSDNGCHTFFVQRPALFKISQLEQMEEAAMRILEEIGVAVVDDDVLQQLSACGFPVKGNRAFIGRKLAREFLETERERNGNKFSESPRPIDLHEAQLELSVLTYPQSVHDMETDKIVPFTTERLIEATKLLDVLSSRGISWSPPGCPVDVPPPLQPLVQYWVAAVYSRHGRHPVDPKTAESMPYIMEMGEVMGHPIGSLPIYIFSPLSLGGESLRCVLKFRDKLSSVGVSDMSSLGCTVPINVGDAFALCAAEVLGSAILVREITDLPMHWSVRLCPMDMHSMAMVLGSPEDLLLQFAGSEVNAYFHGTSWHPAISGAHTIAKLPGPQACAEKSSLMTVGALLGARWLGYAGTLSLDEVFSPEQLLYDIEIKDHVQRIVQGINGDCDPERCLRDVREGLERRVFMGLDTTLEEYRSVYWFPSLFERQFLAAWQGEGSMTIRERAHRMIRKLLSEHDYELEPELRREFDKILTRAKAEFLQ